MRTEGNDDLYFFISLTKRNEVQLHPSKKVATWMSWDGATESQGLFNFRTIKESTPTQIQPLESARDEKPQPNPNPKQGCSTSVLIPHTRKEVLWDIPQGDWFMNASLNNAHHCSLSGADTLVLKNDFHFFGGCIFTFRH